MSMATPTGDAATGPAAWMPDEATLTRMANELFGPLAVSGPAAVPTPASARPATRPATELLAGPDVAAASWPGLDGRVLQGPAQVLQDLPAQTASPAPAQPSGPAPVQAGMTLASIPGAELPVIPGIWQPSYALGGALPGLRPDALAEIPHARRDQRLEPPYSGNPGAASFYFIHELPSAAEAPPVARATAPPAFDVETVRRDFPILRERVHGRQLVWLDNAATTQKPQTVIDRLAYFYAHENSNIHRAAHALAARATDAYEDARAKVADFLGAASSDCIVFTRGTTEAINLVAQAWGRKHIGPDDEIVISHLEHHANIVPWQQLVQETGAKLKVIPVDDHGQLLMDAYTDLLSNRTRLVSVAHVSNVLGTIVPIAEVTEAAHRVGARVLIDGAQAMAHLPVDVQAIDADFYTFSGHKVFAPTGIGALYGKQEVLEEMPPWQGGGNMISDVTFKRTAYQEAPAKFEAGTGSIADAVGLSAALDYVRGLGLPIVEQYEHQLLDYAMRKLRTVPGLRLIGTAPQKASVLTFVLDGCRPEEIGSALDKQGIAVRAGHHCAQPILRHYGVESAVRPSLAMYNTSAEVDLLVSALCRLAADAGRRR